MNITNDYNAQLNNISTNLDVCWDYFLKPNFKGMKKQVDIAHFVKEKTGLNYSTVYSHKSLTSNPNYRIPPFRNLFNYAKTYNCHFLDFFLNPEDFKNKIILQKPTNNNELLKKDVINIPNFQNDNSIKLDCKVINHITVINNLCYIQNREHIAVFDRSKSVLFNELQINDCVILSISGNCYIKKVIINIMNETISFLNIDNIANEDFLLDIPMKNWSTYADKVILLGKSLMEIIKKR